MKPTSVIFLIISVLLVIAGLITVGVANKIAVSEGIVLIENADAEDSVLTYDYSSDNVAKIAVNVNSAEINIIGGAAKSYVELVNFFEGTYDLSCQNRILTVSDMSDISTMEGFGSFITGFKGLRSLVNHYNARDLEKVINIYINSAYPINVADCTVENGNVNISSAYHTADYIIDIGTGDLTMVSVETGSKVAAVIKEGGITMDNCRITDFSADIEKGSVNASAKMSNVDADIDEGDFTYYTGEPLGVMGYAMTCVAGNITINGENYGGYRVEENASTENKLDVSVGTGNIIITSRE